MILAIFLFFIIFVDSIEYCHHFIIFGKVIDKYT